MAEWHLRGSDGQELGPLSTADLKRLADFGQLHPQAPVRAAGSPQWQAAGTIPGLFAAQVFPGQMPQSPAVQPVVMPYPTAQPVLPPLPPAAPSGADDLNPAIPAAIIGVIAVVLGGVCVCGLIAMALIRSSLPPPAAQATPRPAAPGRAGPVPGRGINGRPKEDSDRFRKFAEEAGKVKWTPEANAPSGSSASPLQDEIARVEVQLRTHFARGANGRSSAARNFARLEQEHRGGQLDAEVYLEALRAMQRTEQLPR